MSVIGTLQQMIHDYHDRYVRARTASLINSLPSDIQKDIGWPGFYPDHGVGRGAQVGGLHRQ
jgi:hypothetical protein